MLHNVSIIETQMMGSVRTVISGQPGNRVWDGKKVVYPENGKDEESHQRTQSVWPKLDKKSEGKWCLCIKTTVIYNSWYIKLHIWKSISKYF